MNNIVVPVAELARLVDELKEDGMDYVELSTLEAQIFDGDRIPPCLWASGFEETMPDFRTDYDSIDAVEDFMD